MRVLCRHGHYAFFPRYASEIAEFCRTLEITLVRENDYYTFPALKGLSDYSIKTVIYKDIPAIITFEGTPWEILKQNKFVYNLGLGKVVPLASITTSISLEDVGGYYKSNATMVQAGSFVSTGVRLVDYDASFSENYQAVSITEVSYV